MGSSVEPEEPKGIDASVGGLVWVRRRNGSWWPGRIMGLDELSEGCLVSPRSGTPVKLLGREDASVDWYNLEKSKRVKAFRCGEYDDCIEKAKASAANANKKAVKYARREDAIIHALEIENARLGKDCPDFSRTDNSSGEHGNTSVESPTISHSTHEEDNEDEEDTSDDLSNSEDNLNSTIELSQSGISFEEPSNAIASKMQSINENINERRKRTPNDSEDDGTEGIKRMRGLEDLGMGIAAQQDSASLCDSNNGSPLNGSKTYSSSLRRKRSQVSSNGHEFLKRKNRRRPLAKVLESTAMVSVPVTCDQLECIESKKSIVAMAITNNSDSTVVSCENGVISDEFKQLPYVSNVHDKVKENEVVGISGLQQNDSSDVLFDVPFVGEDKHDAGFSPMMVSSSSEKPENGQAKPASERNEAGSTSSADAHVNNLSQTIDKGTSKWQSKGKRNLRQLRKNKKPDSRNSLDMHDEPGEHFDGVSQVDGFPDWSRRGPTVEKKVQQPDSSRAPQRSLPHRQSRFTVNSMYPVSDFPARTFCPDSQLYDVILEVKASYKPQHVPLVSLMSKLNGKAIIGHPLTVEAMEDGSSDILVNSIQSGKNLSKHPKLQSRYSPVKKKVGILSKKTRKLSSLTASHKQPEERKAMAEKLKGKGPVIACIPLKLVFSRINEAVTRPTHRSLMSSNFNSRVVSIDSIDRRPRPLNPRHCELRRSSRFNGSKSPVMAKRNRKVSLEDPSVDLVTDDSRTSSPNVVERGPLLAGSECPALSNRALLFAKAEPEGLVGSVDLYTKIGREVHDDLHEFGKTETRWNLVELMANVICDECMWLS